MICTKVPILPLKSRHAHFMSTATGSSGKYPLIVLREGSNKMVLMDYTFKLLFQTKALFRPFHVEIHQFKVKDDGFQVQISLMKKQKNSTLIHTTE